MQSNVVVTVTVAVAQKKKINKNKLLDYELCNQGVLLFNSINFC